MKKLIFATGLILCISILVSCLDEFDFNLDKISTDVEQNTNLAIPLVDASITIDELLTTDSTLEKYLFIDENSFLSLQYQFDLANFPAADFFNGDYSGTDLPYYADVMDPQIVELGFNNLLNQGEVYLADPKIVISVVNYWKVSTRFRFTDFYYYEEANSPALPVTGSITTDWISIDKPVDPAVVAVTDIELNSSNSNIADVISSLPHHISFGADFETIPGGPYSIDPGSTDSVKIKIDVPLDIKVTDLILTDTIEFNLVENLGKDTASVDSLKLNLLFDNGYPISLDVQIDFADSNYDVLGSIFDEEISIPAAIVSNGLVTESSMHNEIGLLIDKDKINQLLDSKYLILRATFNTANANLNETVKIYSNYALGLKVGALVSLHLKF